MTHNCLLQFPIDNQTHSNHTDIHLKSQSTFQINFVKVLGLKKIDKNELLFEFLTYELCKFRANHVESGSN